MQDDNNIGEEIFGWARDLFPICRSITGNGVRETLGYLKNKIPDLIIHEVPSGTPAFDWVVPDEWNIRDAYILNEDDNKIVDFQNNNLHVVGYSIPINQNMCLEELDKHLYSIPQKPQAIPYVTSYYEKNWGFCLSHEERKKLVPGKYKVFIDSTLEPGSLTYGEIILPGKETSEVLLSTYVCHPSLANNELSGPVVVTALARWLSNLVDRRHTYRIFFGPETIGSIVYISRHLAHLKKYVIAGYNISCVGDDRAYTYLASRAGRTIADRVALHVLRHSAPEFVEYSFLSRGSDERQYCAPGIDLPVASIMRTKFGDYPEYHTSDDNLSVISPKGLIGGFNVIQRCILCLEKNKTLKTTNFCEPQLGRRGLISNTGYGPNKMEQRRQMFSHLLAYSDGSKDLLEISELMGFPIWEFFELANILEEEGLLENSAEQMGH